MIETVKDRRNSGFCLRCGQVLMIVPWNDYQCCAECTGLIEAAQRRAQNKKGKTRSVGKKVIIRQQVARQIMPLKKGWD